MAEGPEGVQFEEREDAVVKFKGKHGRDSVKRRRSSYVTKGRLSKGRMWEGHYHKVH